MKLIETIKELSLIPGISGREEKVREYILSHIEGHCEYEIDALGNLICYKKGAKRPKNSLYFSAHMDEVGFIVTGITDEGYLRFATVGGIDPRVVFGKAVEIGEQLLPGIIGGNPVHLIKKEEEVEPVPVDKLLIDIGAKDKEDALKHVRVGDAVVYHAPFLQLGEDTILGKAFDDRAGCAMLMDLVQQDLEYDCTIAFTTQEEIGCVGGTTAAFTANADVGVVVESTTASDVGGVEKEEEVCRQGQGPVLSFMDRGAVYDWELFQSVTALAKEKDLPVQAKEGVFGGNEARVIQTAGSGARIVGVSLPTRYLHSPSNTLNIQDIQHTSQLLQLLVSHLAELEI